MCAKVSNFCPSRNVPLQLISSLSVSYKRFDDNRAPGYGKFVHGSPILLTLHVGLLALMHRTETLSILPITALASGIIFPY